MSISCDQFNIHVLVIYPVFHDKEAKIGEQSDKRMIILWPLGFRGPDPQVG